MPSWYDSCSWIWHQSPAQDDEFADFYCDFTAQSGDLTLRVAADSNYAAWLDGQLVAFGQYADYPDHKFYDEVAFPVIEGSHRLAVQTWYYGTDTQTYRRGIAAVIFALSQNDQTLAASGPSTLARLSPAYTPHLCSLISGQLGFTWHYDATAADDWKTLGGEIRVPFAPARVEPEVSKNLHVRPIKKLVLKERCPSQLVAQGTFAYTQPDTDRSAERQQTAALSWQHYRKLSDAKFKSDRPITFRSEDGEGVYLIFDIGREEAGFLELELDVPEACDVEIGYGEHLYDGRCRTAIRGFTADYRCKAGANHYLNTYRRFGCRYIQLFVHSHEVTVRYVGLRPTDYPVSTLPYDAGNPLRNTIYDVCLRTLLLCMHEHYEDCPWREQALYTMDSRNQMLCGYYAFGETQFPRACLDLISHGVGETGLLNLCFPAGKDYPIPFFSLMYFIQMREYAEFSGDDSLIRDHYDMLKTLLQLFLDRRDETGLTVSFTDKKIWNFYEWQPTLAGASFPSHDAPLNGFLSLALEAMSAMCARIGKPEDAACYAAARKDVNAAIRKTFYRPETGLFISFDDRLPDAVSVLTNSLCLLCGAADGLNTAQIEELLVENGRTYAAARSLPVFAAARGATEPDLTKTLIIPNTLSMNCFRFDALLKCDKEKYGPAILSEIDDTYLMMLREGATTFWETVEGAADFDDAGSLCHGWSALPVYYYHILMK